MALMVFGVVLQQPPTREAPTSHHLPTYDTKSSSETPVFCWTRIFQEDLLLNKSSTRKKKPILKSLIGAEDHLIL